MELTVKLALAEPCAVALVLPEAYLARTVARGVIAPVLKRKRRCAGLAEARVEDLELTVGGGRVAPDALVRDVTWGAEAVAVLRLRPGASGARAPAAAAREPPRPRPPAPTAPADAAMAPACVAAYGAALVGAARGNGDLEAFADGLAARVRGEPWYDESRGGNGAARPMYQTAFKLAFARAAPAVAGGPAAKRLLALSAGLARRGLVDYGWPRPARVPPFPL